MKCTQARKDMIMSGYEIQRGDTLSKIAKQFGVTVKQLQDANGIKNPNLIIIGNTLKIPDITSDKAFDIPGFSLERNPAAAENVAAPVDNAADGDSVDLASATEQPAAKIDISAATIDKAGEHPVAALDVSEVTIDKAEEQPAAAQPTAAAAEEPAEAPASQNNGVKNSANNPELWGNFLGTDGEKTMVCRDASGRTEDISGKLRLLDEPKAGEDPQSFTITDSSSGSDHEYLYQKVGVDENGNALYKCVSMNGDPIISKNQYTLQWTDDNKPELVNAKGQDNHGEGLKVGKKEDTPPVEPAPTEPAPVEEPEPEPTPEPEPEPKGISAEERNKAREFGADVSDYLVGYTDDSEQGLTKDIIKEDVTAENVADFLKGYEDNKGLGDRFFEQLRSEWGFRDKQDLMRDVAEKLSENLRANGQDKWADEVDIVLQNQEFSKDDAKVLDDIVKYYLKTLPELEQE